MNNINPDKYGRTYHLPFSLGATSDDKIQFDWQGVLENEIVITEKLDGENTCIKTNGVYARSHVSPTNSPWAGHMWEIWKSVGHQLDNLEIFGENLYGIHSIKYSNLQSHFYVFAIREGNLWLSWDEVVDYCDLLELHTAPMLARGMFEPKQVESFIDSHMKTGSALGGDTEGVVLRNSNRFSIEDFKYNVLKYVRPNHVKTDEHWTRNWKRAPLWYETYNF